MSDIDLSSPEVKEAIKAAVNDATDGLVRKRDELLSELKEARKGKAIDPAQLDKLEEQNEALKSQLLDAQKTVKKATTEAEVSANKLADAEGYTVKLLKDSGLSEALAKAGVTNPVHQKAAKAMLAEQVQIVADGDSKVAKVGEKALSEFITEWAGSDEGKHFVTAADISGGGSQGGHKGGGAAGKSITRAAFDSLSPDAQSAHFRDSGTVTD